MEKCTKSRFDALDFKRQTQEQVQKMLEGLSPDEEIQALEEIVAGGPFRDEWKRSRAEDANLEPVAHTDKRPAVAETR